MRRAVVVGNSGSGKTTLARDLARRLGVVHLELDGVYHQPGWQPLADDEFRARLRDFRRQHPEGWVIDGNYSAVADEVWAAADTVVWLDPPRRTVRWSVIRRTLPRALVRRPLWNGNRESLRDALALHDPERSVIAWAWTRHEHYRRRYRAAMGDPRWAHLTFVRLRSRREARTWLASVTLPSA